jgi:hypothetical protein
MFELCQRRPKQMRFFKGKLQLLRNEVSTNASSLISYRRSD